MLLVMVEVVLVLIQTTSPNRKITLAETGMMGFSVNLRVLEHHPMWNNILLWVINVVLLMVLHLFSVMEMVNMVWFLGPPTFTSRKLIVGLMVVIFCHI